MTEKAKPFCVDDPFDMRIDMYCPIDRPVSE